MNNTITVFTKSWPEMVPEQLAELALALGVDGIELPVREGYAVNPGNVTKELPRAARVFRKRGLVIGSVAGDSDGKTISACGNAGIPIIRICVGIDMTIGYAATERRVRETFDAALPALRKHGVAIGVQNHSDLFIGSAIGLMHLIERYDPKQICAVLDPAHCAVGGEPEIMALDIVWSHLGMVNLKSASRWRINGPDAEEARWVTLWTTARHSGYSWRAMVKGLHERGYTGPICLPAEYSPPSGSGQLMGDEVMGLLKRDIEYLKRLLAEVGGVQLMNAP
ncbi:MAG TPA: TIM barrel protein [Desulfobacterales bacterium]|nr:TIM barrel protein [Desulfobacterales bacterium]